MEWTDSVERGITDALQNSSFDCRVTVEYMDSKKHSSEEHFQMLYDSYKFKYKRHKFDCIITVDDNAYNFVKRHNKELFFNAPQVFCGVNNFTRGSIKPEEQVTGVVEAWDVLSTLNAARALQPESDTVYIVNDNTITGKANKLRIQSVLADYELPYKFLTDFTMDQLEAKVSTLPHNVIVLLMSFNRDKNGIVYDYTNAAEIICSSSSAPVYGVWDFYVGKGIVGGKLISGANQGHSAAKYALSVINGTPISKLPVIFESPNEFIYDYDRLVNWQLDESLLPENSCLANKPVSFFTKHKPVILVSLAIFTGYSILLLLLIVALSKIKRQQQTLIVEEKKYRQIFNATNDALLIRDLNTKQLIDVNMAAEKMYGYEREKLLTMSIEDLSNTDAGYNKEKANHYIERASRGESVIFEWQAVHKTGTLFWTEINLRSFEENGQRKFISVIRDITERRNAQSLMIQTEKMTSIAGLASGMAHEMNNPLAGVMQGTQNVQKRLDLSFTKNIEVADKLGLDKSVLQKYLDERKVTSLLAGIRSSSERAAKIVRNMLKFCRDEAAQKQQCDIHELIDTAIGFGASDYDLNKKYDFKFLNLKKEYSNNIPTILCCPSEIEQVLLNLFKNATQAMEDMQRVDYKPQLVVRTFTDNEWGVIEVEDNGPGIPQHIQNKIFDPFFTTKPVGVGTGLGLSVSYMIITQNHGGTFTVSSKEGEGTTFKICLPLGSERLSVDHEKGDDV